MLLFSTILDIKETMTKEDFIQTVIDWNNTSTHPGNIIADIEYHGESEIRYGDERLWLSVRQLENRKIVAIRYEKVGSDGVIWDTDYVMNFEEHKMSIRLERSYLEAALKMDPKFSTPHFITLLIERGYVKEDGNLAVLRTPVDVTNTDLSFVSDIINGQTRYRLPVVYVSKTEDNNDPVNVNLLSSRLKGVAHVLVQNDLRLNTKLRMACNGENPYYGAIGIYYPSAAIAPKKVYYRNYEGYDEQEMEQVIRRVIQYANDQMVDSLYTYQGVSNELLMEQLAAKAEELAQVENNLSQTESTLEELLASASEDLKRLKNKVEDLTKDNQALTLENAGLRAKIANEKTPVLVQGDEEEFFTDEMKEFVLDGLVTYLSVLGDGSRRKDVVEDLLANNDCIRGADQRREKLKKLLKGYKNVNSEMKRVLADFGFEVKEEGRHYKLTFHGDSRYQFSMAKTPSDHRDGLNIASEISKKLF